MKHKAFTLIELLIVVAIIAILAAIAVPNFLEAQVRSKISRVKSDMRTIGLAIEAYIVDNNSYPVPDRWTDRSKNYSSRAWQGVPGQWWMSIEWAAPVDASGLTRQGNGFWLTSPVAYLTSIPDDPFTKDLLVEQAVSTWGAPVLSASFLYGSRVGSPQIPQPFPPPPPPIPAHGDYLYDNVGYFLVSVASDLRLDYVPAYDPSNGTVSGGDLIYLGTGIGFYQ